MNKSQVILEIEKTNNLSRLINSIFCELETESYYTGQSLEACADKLDEITWRDYLDYWFGQNV